ncbi:YqaA family protein [Flocculibacter collagenilyticus]|uniref:YqaA family protein n=1 Tax=Flocculibacter collagenilyticus TaxID=2744479 RepID=UPI0018F7702D|nr:YqaA family protein [Flocculibacter collagenilyticus]
MKLFTYLYDLALRWAKHRHAPAYLSGLTFAESVFFPIPPDVMLAPMSLAKPHRAWHYALLTTVASVLGGAVGYLLGYALFEPVVAPMIESFGYTDKFDTILAWFTEWGIWVVFLAGFTPIPYKLFTVSAGLLNMLFIPFIVASFVSRGLRFFLVAGLMRWGGAEMEHKLRRYVDVIGWSVIILAVVAFLIYR